MDHKIRELSERFRRGLMSRRDFVEKIVALTGGAVAAKSVLTGLGLSADLIQEARAGTSQIEEKEGPYPSGIQEEEGQYPSGNDMVRFFLAKPAKGEPFRTLIVIHEIFGLTNFIRNVARRFAYEGYLAMAPSLPTGTLPDGKHSEWMLETLQTGVAVVGQPEIDMLNDGYRYLLTRDEVDADHIGSIGFCWGGARSFTLATRNNQLWAAIVCYGSTPPLQDLDNIKAPVIGLYAALDNNSPTSITGRAAETAREMHARGKVFEWEVYDLAAHGFFRAPDGESISQERPAVLGWALLKDFLDRYYPRG